MYLALFIALVSLLLIVWIYRWKIEAFTQEDLNIQISKDNQTLTIPKNLQTPGGTLNVSGEVKAKSVKADNLTVSGTSSLGNSTALSVQIGNATLSNSNGLTINTNVQCKNLNVGEARVQGNLCIESGGHRWYLVAKETELHIVKNNPALANVSNHTQNEPHVIISKTGNIWTSRQTQAGWVGDRINDIRSLKL